MAEEEIPLIRPPLTLEAAIDEIDRLWDKVTELQDIARDLTDRMTDFEHFLARLALPTAEVTLPREELERLIPPIVRGSRWVLEIFPEEIEEWRKALRTIPLEGLTETERSFLRNLDYYIVSERKITLPQLAWLKRIQAKAGGIVPAIPLIERGSEHHSNPNPKLCPICHYPLPEGAEKCPRCLTPVKHQTQRRLGAPKTDIERIMSHYGLSREKAEALIEDVMKVYKISREEAIKSLLPPRGAKILGSSSNPSPQAKWRVYYRPPWSTEWFSWDFTRYDLAKAMKARFERLGYETRPIMPLRR
jgi:hypothetical protein